MKAISIVLTIAFTSTQVLFAHVPETSLWASRRAQKAGSAPQLARLLEAPAQAARPAAFSAPQRRPSLAARHPATPFLKLLPPDIVTVKDVAIAPAGTGPLKGRRFVVVQDVHLNPEAQRNIADLLFRLMGAGETSLVAVEGAVGRFDLARFRRFPDKSVTDAVARAFLVANRIGAPSYAGITSKAEPPLFWGVDDAAGYERNVAAYLNGRDRLPAAQKSLERELAAVEKAKRSAYTPALRALDMADQAHESGLRGLGEHLETLSAMGAFGLVPAPAADVLNRFLEAWKIERSLDFNRADKERRAALEKLVAKLSEAELDAIVQLSLGQREGRTTFADYHRAIASLIEAKGVSLDNLPAFKSYLRYALLSDGIDADALLAAARAAMDAAYAKAAATAEQRALVAATRRLALKKKLLTFSLSPVEWTAYAAGGSEVALAPFEDFYREAHFRSERIAENLAAAAGGVDASKVGVLIVGGFHAPEVARHLAQMGASYAVVSPKLTQIDVEGGTAYLSVFSREKTPLEKLFKGEKLFVYPAHLNVSAAGDRIEGANAEFAAGQTLGSEIGAAAIDAAPQQFLERTAWRASASRARGAALAALQSFGRRLSAAPVAVTGAWAWLAGKMGLSRKWAARLGFVEEILFAGVLLYAVPWVMGAWLGFEPAAVEAFRPLFFWMSAAAFAVAHTETHFWTKDGELRTRPSTFLDLLAYFALGAVFRAGFFFIGADPAWAFAGAVAAHFAWNNVIARFFTFLPVASIAAGANGSWWKDPTRTHVAVSVPIYALRREPSNDPGIGKFTDLGRHFRETLRPQGVNVVLLLPHYATFDESPYAPVSLYALQERYIDWSIVPEVAGDARLMSSLIAPAGELDTINYIAVGQREDRVAAEAFARFRANLRADHERASAFGLFVRQNQGWLREYADFMALHSILDKPSQDWSDEDVAFARANEVRYRDLYELHCFKQWIAYRQFNTALTDIENAGGKLLFDVPFFRGKDSVSVRNHPKYFRDVKTRSAGIKNEWTDQTWGDLALWNWPELEKESFDFVIGPIRHWLRFGLHGARNDALHFAYRIGQFGDGNEPGDAYVARVASTFDQYGAFPLAEAFENKSGDVEKHGIVTIDGNWQRYSTHDDKARNHVGDPVNFFKDILGRARAEGNGKASRFIAFTLGDLDGDARTVKTEKDGRSYWRYRLPLTPPKNLGRMVRFLLQIVPELQRLGRSIWDAAGEVRAMFELATESFIKTHGGVPEIWAASRDWFFEQWGRDTFIALPGLLLATHRYDVARDVMRSFARFERNGLIPNRVWNPNHPESIEYNTSDGSMWFIQSVQKYYEYTGDAEFVREMMPVMRRIMQGYMYGTGWDANKHINPDGRLNDRRIQMDASDGLIVVPAQSTWMDADPHGTGPVTPRSGKPVEINALWYANLRFMEKMLPGTDGETTGEREQYGRIAATVKASFNEKFWNETEKTLFDLAPGGPHHGAIRPNMIFAVSHGGDLLSPERQSRVLESVNADLLTPFGLRTLSPRDSNYRGRYDTGSQPYPHEANFRDHKDFAYHQGTVWPWLMGGYADALAKVRRAQGRSSQEIRDELKTVFAPLVQDFVNQGSLHEVYDGSARPEAGRQIPGGTSSQAWSVSEVFRALAEHGVLQSGQADESNWIADNAPAAAGKTIVEVTMEMALSGEAFEAMARVGIDHDTQVLAAMATSTGGIGPLLKERVIALGDLGAKVVGVSLLYEHVWVQRVTKGKDGAPDEIRQEKVKIGDAFRKVLEPAGEVDVEMYDGNTVKVKVWKAPAGMFGKAEVYYFDNPEIADVVYPGATDTMGLTEVTDGDHLARLSEEERNRLKGLSEVDRLKQNWMVGRGTLALMKKLDRKPDITVMSEMPSTLSFHRLVQDNFTNDPFFANTLYVFNDHTPLEYAHPKWDAFGRTRMKLQPKFYENQDLMTPKGEVDGTAMIINAADVVYGVARKHGDVMRAMPQLTQFSDKIGSITNGVSQSYWPTDEFKDPAQARLLSDDQVSRVKTRRRNELMKWLEVRAGMPAGWAERMAAAGASVGIWTRRVVGYKRMDVFAGLVEDDALRERFIQSNVIFVVGGRIHQDDPFGLIQFRRIQAAIQKDPRLKDRIIFFENYNILDAPVLFRGADFSVMLADDGYEASATGFQKAQMNGDLIIASHDGAVPESVVFLQRQAEGANGFEVPYVEVEKGKPMQPTSQGLMNAFDLFAAARKNPAQYAQMVRNALASAPRVDVVRTAKDMLTLFDGAFRDQAAEQQSYADGRQIAHVFFSNHPMTADNAREALNALATIDAFGWRYREKGVHERSLYQGHSGLSGFLDSYRHVRSIGTAGDWSFRFHASNAKGKGDVIAHLEAALKKIPQLSELAAQMSELAERARLTANIEDRLRITRVAVGLMEAAQERLIAAASPGQPTVARAPPARREPGPVGLGLVGFWSHFPRNFSLGRASAFESLIILLIAYGGLAWLITDPELTLALGDGVLRLIQTTSRVSLLVGAAVFVGLFFAHWVFGVLQPRQQRAPVWGVRVSLKAAAVAMSTMVGFPVTALAALAWRSGADLSTIGFVPIILAMSALGAFLHRRLNKQLLNWYQHHSMNGLKDVQLREGERERVVTHTRVILDELAERTVTDVGPEVERLRAREIAELPAGVTVPLTGNLDDVRADALVILGSHYLDVPVNAARLYMQLQKNNPNMVVVFAGGMGPRTQLRFPYWSSEAELFRDMFINTIRLSRRADIADNMRKMFSGVWGRMTEWFVQVILIIDDALYPLHRTMMPRRIFLDPKSTNTGANIRNVTQIFQENQLAPQNIVLVTADVFQLRASKSWLQQYSLPMKTLYSISANRVDSDEGHAGDLETISTYDLAEIASESHLQVGKLRSYPLATPEPFSIPAEISPEVDAADKALIGILGPAGLLDLAATSPEDKAERKYPTSYLSTFSALLLVIAGVAFMPLGGDATAWPALIAAAAEISADLMAAFFVGISLYVLLFSRSVGTFPRARQGKFWRAARDVARVVVPVVGSLVYASLTLWTFDGWPMWASVLIAGSLGVLMRGWSMSVDPRRRVELELRAPVVPGAAGFWGKTGASLKTAGAWEGAATAVVALLAMGALAFVGAPLSDYLQISVAAKWTVLSAAGLAAGFAAIRAVHRAFGVTPRAGAAPDLDPETIRRAIRSASISLIAVPLLALSLLLPAAPALAALAAGFAAAIIPHARRNASAERRAVFLSRDEETEAAFLAERLRALDVARRSGDTAQMAEAFADLVELENVGLDTFGAEGRAARRSEDRVAVALSADPSAFIDWQYTLSSAAKGRGSYETGTVGGFTVSAEGAPRAAGERKRRDHLALVAAGRDAAAVVRETEQALVLAQGRPLTVILAGELGSPEAIEGRFAGRNVTFLSRGDLASAADVEARLLRPAQQDAGKLKLMIQRDGGLPDFLVNPLLELSRRDAYRDLVEVVIVAALSAGGLAVRASVADLEKALKFRDLVLSQA